MALFKIDNNKKLKKINYKELKQEADIHDICEKNLEELFQVKFLAHKFKFADEYSGEMDTLGIDLDGNPVIVEYKLDKNRGVLSQVLFYMDWLVNHRGDFEVKAKQVLGDKVKIKWDNPKMYVVARDFDRYDKYAVNQINYDIYLYKYIYYENDELYLENINVAENKKYYINQKTTTISNDNSGKYVRREYDYNFHLEKGSSEIRELLNELNEGILNISDQIEVRYPQLYIAYRTTRNFAEVHVHKNHIIIYLMTIDYEDPENKIENVPESYQWVMNKRIYVKNEHDLKYAMKLIQKSYESTL